MTSKIKVDNINKVSDDSNIIKKCGTTTTIGSGASNPIVVDGSAITLGRCGGTVALASGATQTGFGRTGTVDWQTAIKTGDFTSVSGEGYFVNSTSGEIDVTLPSSPAAGAIVAVSDYANQFATNNCIMLRNGSNIEGAASDLTINTEGQSVTLVYADATKGWIVTETGNSTDAFTDPFITATGGTITCSGNDKIHTFTGPGTFQVTKLAGAPACNQLSYMVVAGGGGGGWDRAGGGGAGGFREDKSPTTPYTASPLEGAGTITATVASFPIVVGGGGAGGNDSSTPSKPGQDGNVSTFSTKTSAGGGGGGAASPSQSGRPGGSGGGSAGPAGAASSGNTPPTTPAQGFDGGVTPGNKHGSGGGGATAVGTTGDGPLNPGTTAAKGGAGATTSISGTPTAYAGGGGGGFSDGGSGCSPFPGGAGGVGGGGKGGSYPGGQGFAATANTGGGGGGGSNGPNSSPAANGGNGGSGVIIIRYKAR